MQQSLSVDIQVSLYGWSYFRLIRARIGSFTSRYYRDAQFCLRFLRTPKWRRGGIILYYFVLLFRLSYFRWNRAHWFIYQSLITGMLNSVCACSELQSDVVVRLLCFLMSLELLPVKSRAHWFICQSLLPSSSNLFALLQNSKVMSWCDYFVLLFRLSYLRWIRVRIGSFATRNNRDAQLCACSELQSDVVLGITLFYYIAEATSGDIARALVHLPVIITETLNPVCASSELQSDVVVGLRLPDHRHGQPDHPGGQQHVEQHPHFPRRPSHGLDRGPRLRDHARTRRRLRAGHIWRAHRICIGRWDFLVSLHRHQQVLSCCVSLTWICV